jgi:hypothetical protein
MERKLWPRLYHLIMEVGQTFRLIGVGFQPHIILMVFCWAALHDRLVSWACRWRHWSTTTLRPARLPSPATMSRRLRRLDTAMMMRALVQRLRQSADPRLLALIDGKPLPIGGSGHDPEARCGRGAGMWAKGYKLYAIWAGRPVPETYRVYPMNVNEDKVAKEMMLDLNGGGYMLGDGEYDASPVFDAAGAAGYQLLAPRDDPEAGLGAPLSEPVSVAVHRSDAVGIRPCGLGPTTRDRAGVRGVDELRRRVVAAAVVGKAPEASLGMGECEAGDQWAADCESLKRT